VTEIESGESSEVVLDGTTIEEDGIFAEGGAAKLLTDYWLVKKQESPTSRPQWSQFEMMDIYTIAPRVIIKDVLKGGEEFRNRYWGTQMTNAFHIDATGKITREYLSDEFTRQGLNLLRMVAQDVRPVRVWGRARFFSHTDHKSFEAAFVPLFNEEGRPTQIVSAFNFEFKYA